MNLSLVKPDLVLEEMIESVIQSEVSQKEKKQISYMDGYTWNLEKQY